MDHLTDIADVPLLAMCYTRPSDGLPIFHSWVMTAKDVLHRGFESWRCTAEVRPSLGTKPEGPYNFECLDCVKGLGRLTIILFAVVYTYMHKRDMSEEMQADFTRPGSQMKRVALKPSKIPRVPG